MAATQVGKLPGNDAERRRAQLKRVFVRAHEELVDTSEADLSGKLAWSAPLLRLANAAAR